MQQTLWNTARMVLIGIMVVALLGGCRTFGSIGIGMRSDGSPPPHYDEPPHGKGPPPHAPAHGYREKHRYRYYPSAQVYFDVGRNLYFYFEDGGWRMSASLPHHFSGHLDGYVRLDLETDKPYQHFEEHRKKYPAGHAKKKKKYKKKSW